MSAGSQWLTELGASAKIKPFIIFFFATKLLCRMMNVTGLH